MENKVEFKKIREFGEIISDTFLFIKQNFKPLMTAILYLCGLFLIAGLISSIMAQLQVVGAMEGVRRGATTNMFNMIYNFSFGYLLVMIFMVCSYTSFYVTVLSYISIYIQKGNVAPTIDEVWAYYKYYFFRVMGSGILMTAFLVVCFILCVIPGIWVFPAVSLFYPIMVIENAGLGYSFNRCFKLVADEWWITAATMIVIAIISAACSYVIQVPAMIIAMASSFTHLEQPFTKTYAIITSLAQQLSQVFMVIPIIGATFIYFNLVERKENTGLLSRIESLGQAAAPENSTPEEY
ncbi:MAG: hypothetical protein EOO91_10025 [Pedobacter sp.]|nr:MAG: hypothetical protein EOO91_10025 [Pedobacter sp.]